jgi:hypothetical protein
MLEWLLNDTCLIQTVGEPNIFGDYDVSEAVEYKCKVTEERVLDYSTNSLIVTNKRVYKIRATELNGAIIPVGSKIDSNFLVKQVRMFKDVNGDNLYLKILAE